MISPLQFKNKHTVVLGAKGCGKTVFCKWLCNFYKRHLVIDASPEGEYKGYNRYVPESFVDEDIRREVNGLLKRVVIPKHKKLDLLICEEADLYLPNKKQLTPHEKMLLSLNRHYELAVVFVTRRPQILNTNAYALANYIASFPLIREGDIKTVSYLFPQLEREFAGLSQKSHKFVFFDGEKATIEKINPGRRAISAKEKPREA